MPDERPIIDDRSFVDIAEELKPRIPEDSPEWTDNNESDPGRPLLQLLGWIIRFVRNIYSGPDIKR